MSLASCYCSTLYVVFLNQFLYLNIRFAEVNESLCCFEQTAMMKLVVHTSYVTPAEHKKILFRLSSLSNQAC